jgi:radical SAM-linked protein
MSATHRPEEGAALSRQHEPNPSAAPVQRLRLRYAKRGKLRFMSHRDVARAFERAIRRAGVPMAYSQGFSPHPRISWLGAAPTGAASEAEYVEIAVVREVDPVALRTALDSALPPDLDVLEVVVSRGGSLAERIDGSRWRIELPGVPLGRVRDAVDALLASSSIEVERLTKDGRKRIDVRPAVISVQVSALDADFDRPRTGDDEASGPPYGIIEVVVRQTTPAVRPDDVLSALRVVAALTTPAPAKAVRIAQGRLDDDGRLADPLAPDRGPDSGRAAGEPEHGQRVAERPVG